MLNKLCIAVADLWDYFVDSAKEGLTGLLLLLVIGAVLAGIVYGLRAIARTNEEAVSYICYGLVAIPVVWAFLRELLNKTSKGPAAVGFDFGGCPDR